MPPYSETVFTAQSSLSAIEDGGIWTLADMRGTGSLDLCWINTGKNSGKTGSGKIEIWYTTHESKYSEHFHGCYSYFDDFNARYGTFLLQDMTGDGKADLVFVKNRGTQNGHVELYAAYAESNYQSGPPMVQTPLAIEDDGSWFITDGKDLLYLKTQNTSTGKVELHILSNSSTYQEFTVHEPSMFNLENNGTWTIGPKSAGPWPDLYFIKTRNTGSGKVEVYSASADSKWKNIELRGEGTCFGLEDNGHWLMADWSHLVRPDLVYLKTRDTPNSQTVVYVNSFAPSKAPVTPEYWMSMITDDTLLSALSIPGTHDTPARRGAIEGGIAAERWGACQFQARTLPEQLKGGVRFFDFRVWNGGNLCHGKVTIRGNILSEMECIRDWLKQHPSECVLVSVKWEYEVLVGKDTGESDSFAHWLVEKYLIWEHGFGDVLWTQSKISIFLIIRNYNTNRYSETIPTLGQARGKIVLLKRFKYATEHCIQINIDGNGNPQGPNDTYPVAHRAQDKWDLGDHPVEEKFQKVKQFISDALMRVRETDVFYFNYCSGIKFPAASPEQVALGVNGTDNQGGVNGRLMQYLTGRDVNRRPLEGRIGVTIMDFWDNDSPRYNSNAIINTNFRRYKDNFSKYPV